MEVVFLLCRLVGVSVRLSVYKIIQKVVGMCSSECMF